MNPNLRIIFLSVLSLLTLILLLFPANTISGTIAASVLMVVTITPIILSFAQRDATFLIIYLYFALYSIPPILYYFGGEDISRFRDICQTPVTVYQLTLIMIVFFLGLIWGQWQMDEIKKINAETPIIPKNPNTDGYVVCVIIALICIVFGKSGETILVSGGYGKGETEISTIFAYGIIPLLTGLTYSNTSYKRLLIFALCGFFCIKDLLYGGRIDSIQLCLGLFILYFRYKWSIKKTILFALLAFAVITIWGIFRAETARGMDYAYQHFGEEISTNGNSQDVIYSSLGILYLIGEGILSTALRIQAFFYFILSIFVPFSWLHPIANLSSWEQLYVSTGGGGMISVFLYAMTGWLGIIVVASVLGKCFRKFQQNEGSLYFSFWIILVLANAPRWYAYYLIGIVKFALFGAVFFFIMNKLFPRS